MSRTVAATLAKLRVRYGATWRVTRDETGKPRFIAVRRSDGRRLIAATVDELANLLDGAR